MKLRNNSPGMKSYNTGVTKKLQPKEISHTQIKLSRATEVRHS